MTKGIDRLWMVEYYSDGGWIVMSLFYTRKSARAAIALERIQSDYKFRIRSWSRDDVD